MSAIQQLLTDHIDIWTAAETEKKSGRGRASGNTGSVYGIKKLRELILELAVRGKLVPQDVNDEPASELLKRIQAEKATLIAEGKIKKDKPLAAIPEDEKPFELPKGWELCRFGDLVNIATGKLDANAAVENGKYPFFTCSQTPSKIDTYSFDTSAVLLAGNGDFNVKCYKGKFDAYQRTYVIEPIVFSLKFCFLLVLAQIEIITKNNRGSAIPYLKMGDLTSPVFALPPFTEQHRIVAKVDELMALCDQLESQHSNAAEAHEMLVSHLLGTLTQSQNAEDFSVNWQRIAAHFDTLFTTDASIDALKQTLLQLAVMGKLVPQDANDEPASELLKRIQAEKAKLIAEGKLKKDKPLPPITQDEKPFELPQGWEWARFPELGVFGRGKSKHRPRNDPKLFNPGIYPLVQTGEVARADNVIGEYHSKYSDIGLAQSKMWPTGTLCITIAANIADSALLGFDACFPDSVVGFVPYKPLYDTKYLLAFMKTAREDLLKFAPSTAQKNINLEILESVLIPTPPLNEISRIVVKLEELIGLCDQLKSRITDARRLQQKLADVLVEQAVA